MQRIGNANNQTTVIQYLTQTATTTSSLTALSCNGSMNFIELTVTQDSTLYISGFQKGAQITLFLKGVGSGGTLSFDTASIGSSVAGSGYMSLGDLKTFEFICTSTKAIILNYYPF